MKKIILPLLLISSSVLGSSIEDFNKLAIGAGKQYDFSKIKTLEAKEKILDSLLKNSEYIQLNSGDIIDLRDFNNIKKGSLKDAMDAFRALEGGGTGAGG